MQLVAIKSEANKCTRKPYKKYDIAGYFKRKKMKGNFVRGEINQIILLSLNQKYVDYCSQKPFRRHRSD